MTTRNRVNRGIPEFHRVGLIMEGARHNLLPSNPFSSRDCSPVITGAEVNAESRHRKCPDAPMWSFNIAPGVPFHIEVAVQCPELILGYTFSMFAETTHHESFLIKVTLSDGIEAKCDNLLISQTLTRFEVTHQFASSPASLLIVLAGEIPAIDNPRTVSLGIVYPTVEEGLFASSAIAPADPVGFRAGEQSSYQTAGNFFSGQAGTLSFFFSPIWHGPQLGEENTAFLIDCIGRDQQNAVSIYADGADYGKLKAAIIAAGKIQALSTDLIPVRGSLYSIALRWSAGLAEILVNGRTVAASEVVFPDIKSLGSRVFVGSTERSPNLSAFGILTHLCCWPEWLTDDYLRASIFEAYPAEFEQFMPDWEQVTNRPRVELFKTDCWGFQFALVLLRYIPKLWQEHPPVWLLQGAIDESHCRDEILRFLSGRDWGCVSEYTIFEGRTDLAIHDKNDQNRMLRIEFKVWGRNDYKEIPEKPLKYISDQESIGVVLMINPSKHKRIGDEYRENVASSPTDCLGIIDRPFGDELFPDHFVSIHERVNARAEILHIVLNRQGPFAAKELPEDA